jgi:tetratricopeptide (TPR) repeat protein
MPRRPIQHQLEDESQRVFASALPREWVYRTLDHDYGIDGEVEIFERDGGATGQKFYVQLKARSEPGLETSPRVSVKSDTYVYYSRLELPVLLVLYHAPSKKLFVRWIQSFERHLGGTESDSTILRFAASDEWNERTPDRLSRDVAAIRVLRSPALTFPFPVELEVDESAYPEQEGARIETDIRHTISAREGMIRFVAESPLSIKFAVSGRTATVSIGEFGKATFDVPDGRQEKPSSSLSHDMVIALATVLTSFHQVRLAADLAAQFGAGSLYIMEPLVSLTLSFAMMDAAQPGVAFRLLRSLWTRAEDTGSTDIYLAPIIHHVKLLSDAEADELEILLSHKIDVTASAGDRGRAAILCNNLGNVYTRRGKNRKALQSYHRSGRLDPRYLERAHYYTQIAGLLFRSRRYALASHYYAKGIELELRGKVEALYGDALLFSGRFREAADAFGSYLEKLPKGEESWSPPIAEWRLKHWAADLLRRVFMDSVKRQTRRAMAEATDLRSRWTGEKADEHLEECQRILQLDPLCGIAWDHYGVVHAALGRGSGAFTAFSLAAICEPSFPENWCASLIFSFAPDVDEGLQFLVFATAFAHHEHQLLDKTVEYARQNDLPISGLISAMRQLFAQFPVEERNFDLRIYTNA